MLQKRRDDELNDLVPCKAEGLGLLCEESCSPRMGVPGFRKHSTKRGGWRKGRRVIPDSKAPGCDWDKSLVMEGG